MRPGRLATALGSTGLIVVLWRAGLRIHEALSLLESELDQRRGSILVRHGKNDRRREVGMDAWGWSALDPWLAERIKLPVGPLFCVIVGPTRGHRWSESAARLELMIAVHRLPTLSCISLHAVGARQSSRIFRVRERS